MFGLKPPRHISTLHVCDMPGRTANFRYWGEIGLNADIAFGLA